MVGKDQEGTRLDIFVALHIQELSRARVQQLIKQDCIRVNEISSKSGYRVREGDKIRVRFVAPKAGLILLRNKFLSMLFMKMIRYWCSTSPLAW